jgi:hypothetical protein
VRKMQVHFKDGGSMGFVGPQPLVTRLEFLESFPRFLGARSIFFGSLLLYFQ